MEKYPVFKLYNVAEPDKAYDKRHHLLNPFKSKETSHLHQMDQSIFVFRVGGCCFFYSYTNFNRTSCKQTLENLIRHCSLWRLIFCMYYLSMSHKKDASLILVKYFCCICYSHHFFVSSSNWIMIGYRAVLTI